MSDRRQHRARRLGPGALVAFLALWMVGCERDRVRPITKTSVHTPLPRETAMGVPPPREEAEQGLVWEVPPGWTEVGGGGSRLADFRIGAVECYVTVFPGDGGGVLPNANRWRGQMGHDPVSAEQLAQGERVRMLGTEAVLVDVEGGGQRLFGVICETPGQAVFVKMIGAAADVAPLKGAFTAFCESLRYGS